MSDDYGYYPRPKKASEKDWTMRLEKLRKMAADYGWPEVAHQTNIFLLSFAKGGVRVNIYYSKMTLCVLCDGQDKTTRHASYDNIKRALQFPPTPEPRPER